MEKKELHKLLKMKFAEFSKAHGFVFLKPSLLVSVNEDVLQIINFDLTPAGINCSVAIQPLYILFDTIVLNLGNRLNHFNTRVSGVWCNGDKVKAEDDFEEMLQLLEQNVVPWFQNVASATGIAQFIESGLSEDSNIIVGFNPNLRKLYLAYTYLYLEMFGKAVENLHDIIRMNGADTKPWVVNQNKMIIEMLSTIEKNPQNVRQELLENVVYTKESLKLK